MGCELSNTAVGSQKLNEGSHSNSSTEDCSTSRNTTESENNNCTATHLERTKVGIGSQQHMGMMSMFFSRRFSQSVLCHCMKVNMV